MPEDVDAVHCAPDDDPDDAPLELLELPDPLEVLELLEPLDPLELPDPDEVLELLEEPVELAEEPLDVLDPLLEPPRLPLLLPPPLVECPDSERPPSSAPELPSEPPSGLKPPSSAGFAVSDVAHAEAMPALNPARQRTREIRGVLAVEIGRSGFKDGRKRRIVGI